MTQHTDPVELLERIRRQQNLHALHLDGNRWRPERPPTVRDEVRNFVVCFVVGLALTVGLLVLAGLR